MSAIKNGDLVIVARAPHVHAVEYLHTVHFVRRVELVRWVCADCGFEDDADFAITDRDESGFPVAWLKKIDPPKVDEGIQHEEQIPA